MKKFIIYFLCCFIALSSVVTAFADDFTEEHVCEICGVSFDTVGDYFGLEGHPDTYQYVYDSESRLCMVYPAQCCSTCTNIKQFESVAQDATKAEVVDALVPDSELLRPSDFDNQLDYYSYLVEHDYMSSDALENYVDDLSVQVSNQAAYMVGSPADVLSISSEVSSVGATLTDISNSLDVLANSPSLGSLSEVDGISLMSVSPITPSDTTGLKAVLLDLLGSYDPVIVEYRYQNYNQSTYSYLREVQPDYVWMGSFLLLCLFVYCIFKLGGGLLCNR